MKIRMKAYTNHKNGQVRFHLPKKVFKISPKELEFDIDPILIKKGIFGGKIRW